MATRLKTVYYAFPALASLANNTATALTQITVYIPDLNTTTPVFRSVVVSVTGDDIITATGGTITTKTMALSLGGATATSVANANTLSNTGENLSFYLAQDFTAHFNTNWTAGATNETLDLTLTINQSTGTTLGMVNVCALVEITYEVDDTINTQLKSVMIPLNMQVGTIDTTATTRDTIPALDTYLPEGSKTYRQMLIVVQGNDNQAGATTDTTMTLRVGTATVTTGNYEGALASDRYHRYIWNATSVWPATNVTQTWQPTATIARWNHMQAYLIVTYEYSESGTSSVMNSLMLPMEVDSPMGGTTSSDYQRATRELRIAEPGTIVTNKIAFFPFWTQVAAIGGLNMRIGTGSFVTYTDAVAMQCGSNAAMVRNDSAFTLARGNNLLNFDVYRTDTGDFGWNMSGFWLVNYTSDKASAGTNAHNHTVVWSLQQTGTGAGVTNAAIAATAPNIPEANYYIAALGTHFVFQPSGTSLPIGYVIQVERLAAEGGVAWENVYSDLQQCDAETGMFFTWSQMKSLFKRWVGDVGPDRMDIETSRRWKIYLPWQTAATAAGWPHLSIVMTYHSITYTISGTISNSNGGTVSIDLYREATGERVMSTSRSGNGTYSFTWIDNVDTMFVEAYEDSTHLGRSTNGVAS